MVNQKKIEISEESPLNSPKLFLKDFDNLVFLKGKVSRKGYLKYTPAGTAVYNFTLAVQQGYLTTKNVGYFSVILIGELAKAFEVMCRVGKKFQLSGKLWDRKYRNRQGRLVSEVSIIANEITGDRL